MSGSSSIASYEPYALGIPRAAAACRALPRSREAMAVTVDHCPCCIEGMTLRVAMLATPRMPQRILSMRVYCYRRAAECESTPVMPDDEGGEFAVRDDVAPPLPRSPEPRSRWPSNQWAP